MDQEVFANIKRHLMDFYETSTGVDLDEDVSEPDERERMMTRIDAYVYRIMADLGYKA